MGRFVSVAGHAAACPGGGGLGIPDARSSSKRALRANDVVTGVLFSIIQQVKHANWDSETMAEYKHGEMNIDVQTKTFNGFIKATTWCVVAIALLCLFLAVFAS